MTYNTKAVVIITALAILLTFGWTMREGKEPHIPEPETAEAKAEVSEEVGPIVEHRQDREEWLADLIMCESSGNPNAINEMDLDGTPSYGLLQFKPSTFEHFSKAYGIDGELMDPEAQKAIVRRMMDDQSVRWDRQFPWCVRRLGWPPK